MKRVIVLLLLVCYLIPAIGITVATHYCKGKFASISLQLLNVEKCKCGSAKMKKDCCKTNTCSIKLKDEQKQELQLSVDFGKKISAQAAFALSSTIYNFSGTLQQEFYMFHPPSILQEQPLYLLHGVFRI